MAYRALGANVPQADIWKSIRVPDRLGQPYARTHGLVRDAETRGFAAVALRVRDARASLRYLLELDAIVILNHRQSPTSSFGHFSVLQDLSAERIVRHDPEYGARHSQDFEEFLKLWRPAPERSEITGNIAVVLARSPDHSRNCAVCEEPLSNYLRCPVCASAVYLQPSAALGCTSKACTARTWSVVICPSCDAELEPTH